eukprot:gene21988-28463_t
MNNDEEINDNDNNNEINLNRNNDNSDDEDDNRNAPLHLICPISHRLLVDPVSTIYGNTYSREHIERWFQTHDTDPMNNERVPTKYLVPNRAIQDALDDYNKQH